MAQYGELRADFITYTTGVGSGEANHTVTVSSLVNNPTFSGNVIVSGDLGVSGIAIINDITVTGNAIFESGITVTGDTNIDGNTNISGLLTVSGITVTGNATVEGDLIVSGNISGNTSGIFGYWERSGTTLKPATLNDVVTIYPGSPTSPGFTPIDDPDTGIYSDVANTISIAAAGTSGLTVASGLTSFHTEISGATDGGVNGSGYWRVAAGSTGERPLISTTGMIRFNTTLEQFEGYDGNWSLLGGGATGSGGDRVFVLNETGVTTDYTLTGFNASSAGPITIEDGVEVIVTDPFNWSIV